MSATGGQRIGAERFIDPAVLARIGNLELLARVVVQGFLAGSHRAMMVGASTDFAGYRTYTPGDDVRHVDWKLYGRTDRLYLKTFEAQTNADVMLVVDVSGSMAYGTRPCSKFEYASFVAASFAWLGRSQRDRVGLALIDSGLRQYIPPSVGRSTALLHALHRAEPSGQGNLHSALQMMANQVKRRGVVVVISDFYDEVQATLSALDTLRVHGHEIVVVQVLDDVERELSLEGALVLEDMETGERLPVITAEVRDEYQAAITQHHAALAEACGRRNIDYISAQTSMPLDNLLFDYLSLRARRAKVR